MNPYDRLGLLGVSVGMSVVLIVLGSLSLIGPPDVVFVGGVVLSVVSIATAVIARM